jgi:hypothetical protein
MFILKLYLLVLLIINLDPSASSTYDCVTTYYRCGYTSAYLSYFSFKTRYRIKYFSGRALYYSNTTASYSTSSVILDISGDIEKNPGPNVSGSEDQESSNTSCKRPASKMSTEESNPYDIGIFRFPNARHLSNEQKYDLILKCWHPEPSYNFPRTAEGRNTRSFRYEWLRAYPWLRYSPMYDGMFCLPCVLFGKRYSI